MGDFNSHAPFWDKECLSVTCNRLVENIVDSTLCLLNDGNITRIPDISTHRPSAIDLTLVSSDLAINSIWSVENDSLGSDHLPIVLKLDEENEIQDTTEDKIPKFKYHLADWDGYQSFLSSIDINTVINKDIDTFYANLSSAFLKAAEKCIPKVKQKTSNKHKNNVWWNEECAVVVTIKKIAF